jgi:Ca-activated chloride channel family protein
MLASSIGKPDLIEAGDLDKEPLHATVRALLAGVERSSGSSGWLADLYREREKTGGRYDAMWNYEAVIKDTNDKLREAGTSFSTLYTRRTASQSPTRRSDSSSAVAAERWKASSPVFRISC